MALFELDDVFTYQDANDIKRMWAGTADPDTATADEGEIYLNIGSAPFQFKRFNGTVWEVIGQMTAQEILDAVKTVDGSGSGLDADTLDGAQPSTDASNDTIVQRASSGYVYANYFNTTSGNSTTPAHIYGSQDDFIRKVTPSQLVTFVSSADGAGSGLDADKVDGLEGSQFIRSDADDSVTGHTEWQDTYQVRLGNGSDLRLQHTGTLSYIDNYTGHLYIRQFSHGSNMYLQAENASGTMQTLLTLDPDTERVTTKLDRASLPDLWKDSVSLESDNVYIQTGSESNVTTAWKTIYFDEAFTSSPRVICTGGKNISATTLSVWKKTTTTTYFQVQSSHSGTTVAWLAIGQKA